MDEDQKDEQNRESDTEATPDSDVGPGGAKGDGSAETGRGDADRGDREVEDGFEEEPSAMATSTGSADDTHRGRRIMNPDNEQILGVLTVEFPERTVSVLIDGDAAMRVLEAHRRGTRHYGALGDVLNPYFSSARNGWITLDPSAALLVSGLPGLPAARERMAVDPAIPEPTS
jgi:hypothetical protein